MAGEEALGQDYLLHEVIGEGAFGVVRLATRREGGAPLAAKLIRGELATQRQIRNRFLQEGDILLGLHHDTIVAVHDLVLDRGRLALIMEYVAGPDLGRYLKEQGGALPPADACAVAAQLAAGLAAAHVHGVVHLDLKPANVLVASDTCPPTVKITDFGVAALLRKPGGEPNRIAGTPGYLAPEILSGGPVTTAADVFALGIVLVEMLAGSRPRASGAAPDLTGVPGPLRPLLQECLAPDPGDRPSAGAVAVALRKAAPALADLARSRPGPPQPGHEEPARPMVDGPLTELRPHGTQPAGNDNPPARAAALRRWRVTLPAAAVVVGVAVAATLAVAGDDDLSVEAVPAYQGCVLGYVCLYPDAGWNGGRPSHQWSEYGAYNLVDQHGRHRLYNNRTDGGVVSNCASYNGTDCGGLQRAATWADYTYDRYRSVLITSRAGAAG